ncbi:hypothetical protein P691DRAFT_782419 [Macrolepiota fuliginosa MF-IS2]|uniref:N-acetyltransferase domain-containing protein n=1 Tax=Macrolepiota fuliginosa MF-IS2 TaxID=1400762 RepID=A0A9P5XLI4_9AGAR|nr:hypothetical protein P691DRAFT_782419 [Macrolepiota fuliginosa MF-IS2]
MQLREPCAASTEALLRETDQRSYQAISSSPLPEIEVSPIVTPLQDRHIKKASKSWVDAFEKDPNRKQTPDVKDATQIIMFCVMVYWRRRKIALTVDAGASIIFCTAPKSPRSLFDRCADWRAAEVQAKVKTAVSRSLGNRVEKMLYIDTLATEPTSQGWGYGGALLDSVGALADVTNQAVWLQSTNERNASFYLSHGYSTIDEAVIGDDNPNWHGAPVIIKIMVREPRPQRAARTDERQGFVNLV